MHISISARAQRPIELGDNYRLNLDGSDYEPHPTKENRKQTKVKQKHKSRFINYKENLFSLRIQIIVDTVTCRHSDV